LKGARGKGHRGEIEVAKSFMKKRKREPLGTQEREDGERKEKR